MSFKVGDRVVTQQFKPYGGRYGPGTVVSINEFSIKVRLDKVDYDPRDDIWPFMFNEVKSLVSGPFMSQDEAIAAIFGGPLGVDVFPPPTVRDDRVTIDDDRYIDPEPIFRAQKINEKDDVYLDRIRKFYGLTVEQFDQIWDIIAATEAKIFWPTSKGIEDDCS